MSSPDTLGRRRARRRPRAFRFGGTRGGFTLIEVLAAVALLGILYTVLARVAIEGLRAEGDSERRLSASLIADETVNDMIAAPAPAFGRSDTAQDLFTITTEVTPFLLPPQWGLDGSDEFAPLLLKPEQGGGTQALRSVRVTVAWLEGASERHVSRTLFMLDFQNVGQVASAVGTTGGQPTTGGVSEQGPRETPPPDPVPEPEPEQEP